MASACSAGGSGLGWREHCDWITLDMRALDGFDFRSLHELSPQPIHVELDADWLKPFFQEEALDGTAHIVNIDVGLEVESSTVSPLPLVLPVLEVVEGSTFNSIV